MDVAEDQADVDVLGVEDDEQHQDDGDEEQQRESEAAALPRGPTSESRSASSLSWGLVTPGPCPGGAAGTPQSASAGPASCRGWPAVRSRCFMRASKTCRSPPESSWRPRSSKARKV